MEVSLSEVRHIVGILAVNGAPCIVKHMNVSQSVQQDSDTVNATLAMDGQALPMSFWETAGDIQIEAYVLSGIIPLANFASQGGLLFTGTADHIFLDYEERLIKVSGRDKSKGPIEAKSTESWKNKTASEIVTDIAKRHGLKPVIDATADKAGKIQDLDWAHISDEVSEWTVVQQLADREGKIAYVHKNELHFKDLDDDSMGAYTITYTPPNPLFHATGTNHTRVTITRNLEAARPTNVGVSSWHSKDKTAYKTKQSLGGKGKVRDYDFDHAGMRQSHIDKIAKKRLRECTRHELTVDFDAPGRSEVSPRMRLVLAGYGELSQSYFIDKLTHNIGGQGYAMSGTARNTSKGRS